VNYLRVYRTMIDGLIGSLKVRVIEKMTENERK
jgi:hypothetical protein